MRFAHDTQEALRAAVVLANSAEPPDTLTSTAELDRFLDEFGYSGSVERTRDELDTVRALRPALRELLTVERDHAALIVNDWLRRAHAVPQLVRHDDWDWHVHAISSDAPLARRIQVETAIAMIDLIRADEFRRLSICADHGCDAVVLDLTRNRSRRYCSTTCSNRAAQAAFRARRGGA